ncbi:outer membrane beta-barrel protein [Novosphingobium sp. RD2P27]|uniref:Outer membrane beta-barrel protein n=1 Tax=Novosphingobium kalidii TaxID=3230299 RepID=A0ABV2CXV5_9SPHN
MGAVAAAGAAAHAQDVSASPVAGTQFDRGRSIAVSQRVQPGYEEVGTRLDGFIVYPRLTVQASFDDNVRASSSSGGDQSDVAFSLAPALRAISQWRRHELGLSASANVTRFASLKTENAETFAVRGEGRYDAGDEIKLYGYAGYRRDVERRTAPGALRGTRRPARFNTATAGAQLTWQNNRLRVSGSGSAARINYADVTTVEGRVIDSRELSRTRYETSVRADYAITPNIAVLLSGTLGKVDFDETAQAVAPDRSARKAELLGGVSFEFTDLLRGEFALGYIDLRFRNPAIRGFSGFGGRAELEYFPTRLTTARIDASRTLQDAGNPLAPSYQRSHIGLRVDHELYRHVLVSAFGNYEDDRFQLPRRTERRWHGGVSGQYLVSRHATLFARYDYLHVTTRPSEFGRQLTDNVISVGVLLKP